MNGSLFTYQGDSPGTHRTRGIGLPASRWRLELSEQCVPRPEPRVRRQRHLAKPSLCVVIRVALGQRCEAERACDEFFAESGGGLGIVLGDELHDPSQVGQRRVGD